MSFNKRWGKLNTLHVHISFILLMTLISLKSNATIYGENDLKDIFDVRDSHVEKMSEAVAVLVHKNKIKENGLFSSRTLTDTMLCPDESFASQPITASCTGTLISPKHILTAAHCFNAIESVCESSKWIFDYKYGRSEDEVLSTSSNKIYSCQKIVQNSYLNNLDYLIIELDRIVTDIEPVSVDIQPLQKKYGKEVRPNSIDVFAITSPRGLPLKYSKGQIRSNQDPNHFVTNVDLMRGSSGGPIFDTSSKKLIGIVAQGDIDYEMMEQPFCNRFYTCSEDGCRGEYATRVSQIPNLENIIALGYRAAKLEQSYSSLY